MLYHLMLCLHPNATKSSFAQPSKRSQWGVTKLRKFCFYTETTLELKGLVKATEAREVDQIFCSGNAIQRSLLAQRGIQMIIQICKSGEVSGPPGLLDYT